MKILFRKTVLLLLCLLPGCLLPGFVLAQQKIAVINIEAAMLNSDYAKESIKKLKEKSSYKSKLDEYARLRKEFQALNEDAKTNGLTWSDKQKLAHKEKIEAKVQVINQVGSQLEAENVAVEKGIQQELTPKIEKIVSEMIKEKELGLLINARASYFHTPDFDITTQVIERLNKSG